MIFMAYFLYEEVVSVRLNEKEDFLSIILLFGSARCLVMAQTQFSLIKINIGRPEHSLTPHTVTSDNILFLP